MTQCFEYIRLLQKLQHSPQHIESYWNRFGLKIKEMRECRISFGWIYVEVLQMCIFIFQIQCDIHFIQPEVYLK